MPRDAHRDGAWAFAPSRSIPRPMPARSTSRWRTRRYAIGPAPARESYLDIGRILDAARKSRRRCDPSRLWLPVRECRFRRGLRGGGHRLRRPAARRRSARMGDKARGQGADGSGRRPDRAGLSRRRSGRGALRRRGGSPGLSRADQGVGRRRRARHARRRERGELAAGARRGAARGARRVRRRPRCWSRNIWPGRAISRCRCSPTAPATWCISSSATARCSGATRR